MNRTEEIRTAVTRALASVAPEADLSSLDAKKDLRDALDLDSMDFLRFVTAIHDTLHVDVPERDYGKVRTLDDCIGYLGSKLS